MYYFRHGRIVAKMVVFLQINTSLALRGVYFTAKKVNNTGFLIELDTADTTIVSIIIRVS